MARAQLFGMTEVEAKDGVSSNCRSVLLHAGTEFTDMYIIFITDDGSIVPV